MTVKAKVIKIGNSRGVRLSGAYLNRLGIMTGDDVEVSIKKSRPDTKKAIAVLRELAKMGAFAEIKDPVAWQRKLRSEWDTR